MPAKFVDPFDVPEPFLCSRPEERLTYEQVKQVVNKHDPLGLLRGLGAPPDEYDPEIKDIVSRRNVNNSMLSPDEIRVIFEYWFHPNCIHPNTAKDISAELQALFLFDDT